MPNKKQIKFGLKFLLASAVLFLLLFPFLSKADWSIPTPIVFIFEPGDLPEVIVENDRVYLIDCEDALCEKMKPDKLQLSCSDNGKSCRTRINQWLAPGFGKLLIEFPDFVKESNVFEFSQGSRFSVQIIGDNLKVGEALNVKPGDIWENKGDLLKDILAYFGFAFLLTIITELAVGLIFILLNKAERKILLYILIANIITISLLSLVLFFGLIGLDEQIVLAELLIILFEALFIFYVSKKQISLKKAMLLSFIANIASVLAGIGILLLI